MAKVIKNIEKEFILREAMKERSITMNIGTATDKGGSWSVKLISIDSDTFTILHNAPLTLLKKGTECSFEFTLRDQNISFKSIIIAPGEKQLILSLPDKVFKNLSRRFLRLPPPEDMSVSFNLDGELYDLDFPSINSFKAIKAPELSMDFNPSDLKELVNNFDKKALAAGNERSIIMFKDRKPANIEESLATSTGRCFFVPNVMAGVPISDPFANRTILIKEDFINYFLALHMEKSKADRELELFEQKKAGSGLLSELIVPIIFQNYVIACVRIANSDSAKPAFDLDMLETFNHFARVFAWSLKLHGYFKEAPKIERNFKPQLVDISAGGLLFTCDNSKIKQALKEDSSVNLKISFKKRSINASGLIRSQFSGSTEAYYGIEFRMMEPEDFRFLYESLYGMPFTDQHLDSVEGSRISSSFSL